MKINKKKKLIIFVISLQRNLSCITQFVNKCLSNRHGSMKISSTVLETIASAVLIHIKMKMILSCEF